MSTESIPVVDLRLLSQAEISALVLSSSPSPSNPLPEDPKIDRSTFNESAGSRKQTYSRLRLAPPLSSPRRRGRPPRPLPPTSSPSSSTDDNRRILVFLRRLFVQNGLQNSLLPSPEPKPRRGSRAKRPRPVEPPPAAIETLGEAVNARGGRVDLAELAGKGDSVFEVEIARRTIGLDSEDGLLEFLGSLEGKWATARKRRRIVDAAGFGDMLPRGWKLLLALKRKEGKIWVHCRRFISPGGKHFTSCREASIYMLSIVEPAAASFPNGSQGEDTAMAVELITHPSPAGPTQLDNCKMEVPISPSGCLDGDNNTLDGQFADQGECQSCEIKIPDKDTISPSSGCPAGALDTSSIQIVNLLECRKCETKFPDKSTFDQHFLTVHLSAKRSSFGKSIASGVIIKDGKYECQFCHKIFTERRRYNGHVGVHVRFHLEDFEASPYMIPAEPRPQPALSSSEKQDEQVSPEAVESLPCVGRAVSVQDPSSIDDLPLSFSEKQDDPIDAEAIETGPSAIHDNSVPEPSSYSDLILSHSIKDEIIMHDTRDRICSDSCHSNADIPKSNETKINEENSLHLTSTLSYSTLDPTSSNPSDMQPDNCDHMSEELKNDTNDHKVMDTNVCADVNSDCEEKNDFMVIVPEKPDTVIVNSAAKDTGESLDGNIEESYKPVEIHTNETGIINTGGVHMNANADVGCDQSDEKFREAEVTSTHYDGSMQTWVAHYNSSEEHFQASESDISSNGDEESRLPDQGCSLEAGVSFLGSSTDNVDDEDVADHMMGEMLGNGSEMNNIHDFDATYNKDFMMPCNGTTNETSVDISGVGQVNFFSETSKDFKNDPEPVDVEFDSGHVDFFSQTNKNFKSASESVHVNFSPCSSACNTMSVSETVANDSNRNEEHVHNIVRNNLHMIAKSPDKMSTGLHASVSQSSSALGVAKPSDVTYIKKDTSVDTMVDENRNYHSDYKFSTESNISNISSIWQQSTEGGIYANRSTDGLENSICDQQFYLEENLHSLSGAEPSYNIHTAQNNILASVVEEPGVASVNNYNRPEGSLLVRHGLSSGNAVGNKFVPSNSRHVHDEKDSLHVPHSSDQSFGITSHANSIYPFDVQESFICPTRNPQSAYDGSLGCTYGGSGKVPVVNNSGIAGANLLGNSAARPLPQWIQPSPYFSSASIIPNQQEKGDRSYYTDQQRECVSGFEDMRADEYGRPASGLLPDQDSSVGSAQHMTFDYSGNIGNVYAPPIQLDWNMAVPQMNTRQQVTTTCMWCGDNFTQGSNIQVQPDSIGFICPTCKAKISGQLKF